MALCRSGSPPSRRPGRKALSDRSYSVPSSRAVVQRGGPRGPLTEGQISHSATFLFSALTVSAGQIRGTDVLRKSEMRACIPCSRIGSAYGVWYVRSLQGAGAPRQRNAAFSSAARQCVPGNHLNQRICFHKSKTSRQRPSRPALFPTYPAELGAAITAAVLSLTPRTRPRPR